MSSRWLYFILVIFLGLAGGLLIGWVILPAQYAEITSETLRVDYQTDYILMVAEVYNQNQDIFQAVSNLDFLGTSSPVEKVRQAILFAEPRYADADLNLLRDLFQGLQILSPTSQPDNP